MTSSTVKEIVIIAFYAPVIIMFVVMFFKMRAEDIKFYRMIDEIEREFLRVEIQREKARQAAAEALLRDPVHILFEVPNADLRQQLIDRNGGLTKLIHRMHHTLVKCIQMDNYGMLLRVRPWPNRTDTFHYVRVENGTKEPDGSRKIYYLEVPPDMKSAKQAVAWTYGLTEEEYNPVVRT